ncbi:MAG TPA: hypothetical protein VGM37_01255 [Armatimonadota bacterium]|jgi:hypothetical protein
MSQAWTDELDAKLSDMVDGTHAHCRIRLRMAQLRERRLRSKCRRLTRELRERRRATNWFERTYLNGAQTTCWEWMAVGALLGVAFIAAVLAAAGHIPGW